MFFAIVLKLMSKQNISKQIKLGGFSLENIEMKTLTSITKSVSEMNSS